MISVWRFPKATVPVGSQTLDCEAKRMSAPAQFTDGGSHPQATVDTQETTPGGIVQGDIKTRFDPQPVVITAKLVDFRIGRD